MFPDLFHGHWAQNAGQNHPLHPQYPQTILKQWMTLIYVMLCDVLFIKKQILK